MAVAHLPQTKQNESRLVLEYNLYEELIKLIVAAYIIERKFAKEVGNVYSLVIEICVPVTSTEH